MPRVNKALSSSKSRHSGANFARRPFRCSTVAQKEAFPTREIVRFTDSITTKEEVLCFAVLPSRPRPKDCKVGP